MIVFTQSTGGNCRVFIPRDASIQIHFYLKAKSIWKGSDKEMVIDGVDCQGYEFSSYYSAFKTLQLCASLL